MRWRSITPPATRRSHRSADIYRPGAAAATGAPRCRIRPRSLRPLWARWFPSRDHSVYWRWLRLVCRLAGAVVADGYGLWGVGFVKTEDPARRRVESGLLRFRLTPFCV